MKRTLKLLVFLLLPFGLRPLFPTPRGGAKQEISRFGKIQTVAPENLEMEHQTVNCAPAGHIYYDNNMQTNNYDLR